MSHPPGPGDPDLDPGLDQLHPFFLSYKHFHNRPASSGFLVRSKVRAWLISLSLSLSLSLLDVIPGNASTIFDNIAPDLLCNSGRTSNYLPKHCLFTPHPDLGNLTFDALLQKHTRPLGIVQLLE
jgi:hypothetical protein